MKQNNRKPFDASQFVPTEFDTAEQKAKFANQFVNLVNHSFDWNYFPKWFYQRLSNTFTHIAHYNQAGFYDTWFSTTAKRVDFLEYTLSCQIFGDPKYTYSDVEKVIQSWLRRSSQLEFWQQRRDEEIERRERAELERLQAKYPNAS